MIIHKRRFRGLTRVLLAGILLFNSVALGAAKGGKKNPRTREVPIGLRLPDGNELYFKDCARLDVAVNKGEVAADGSGCLGLTPLHWAVVRHPDKVAALLSAGANLNAKATGGLTPLHAAAQSGSYDVALFLLSQGADPQATLNNRKTALHVLYSPSACTSCEGKPQQASREEIATRLVEAGVSPNARDTAGVSALHYAAMGTDAQEATAELMLLRADPSVRDDEGAPVSFYASLAGNTVTAEWARLAAGNPVDDVDLGGRRREEWALAKKTEMDVLRDSFKPETLTGPAASGPAGVRFSDCHYWMGGVCALMGSTGCFFACIGLTGPFAFLCGMMCGLLFYIDCWTAVELTCGPG